MKPHRLSIFLLALLLFLSELNTFCSEDSTTVLPDRIEAFWDLSKADHEKTPSRERICINGLWQWQPADETSDQIPKNGWGYIKVPGTWPDTNGGYMWRESQSFFLHPDWKNKKLGDTRMAWYQREITIPKEWDKRRIAISSNYLNSFASVFIDGVKAGDIHFWGGEVDITTACHPGSKHILTMAVVAMPLNAVVLSYHNTNEAKQVEGNVARRGLCGDVYLVSTPPDSYIQDVKIETSVQKWEITLDTELRGIEKDAEYYLYARIMDGTEIAKEFKSNRFRLTDFENGRFSFSTPWHPEKLWDVHTPLNRYQLQLVLIDSDGTEIDEYFPVRFGFREFWIDGRDFYLNGSRIFCFAVPFDNAQVSAAAATYEGARETMQRLKTFGVNAVYTHNYGCEPGSHLSFDEILRAADDEGMLIFFSLPHFNHYEWENPDADQSNGYARHAEFYIRQAQNHPSVVMYSMSHNATGYSEDMNPDLIDGIHAKRDSWAERNSKKALRAEAIAKRFDQSRTIYHHAGGNLGPMHTSNFYLNFVPIQERSDWFEHWATEGIKPLFLCEYGAPWGMNWTLYRGWYQGKRDFGGAAVPWQFCVAEWNSQFLGDRAFQLNEMDKANLRFEAEQARAGRLWHRWDYPYPIIGSYSRGYDKKEEVWSMYITDNWRAFRTWGVSAFNVWSYGNFWELKEDVDTSRIDFPVDWENLQKPGFSPDYIGRRYERFDMAYERNDWIPTAAAQALIRNNQPLLAYFAGKASRFTSKDHNFRPGDIVEKQIIIINNSRETVTCKCSWTLDLPNRIHGKQQIQIKTGQKECIALELTLPDTLKAGEYELTMTADFDSGQVQEDSFLIHVLPKEKKPVIDSKIALFDPEGETSQLLSTMNIEFDRVDARTDLSPYNILIIGKAALTLERAAPNIERVRDGLKVLVFEQTPDVLEKRLGFRVQEYGLRRVFPRVPHHPILDGLSMEHLHDWQGESTIIPPRLDYELRPRYGPTVEWCGIEVPRAWRCGRWGNVASVLLEKPVIGDYLPIVDGGFSLQYSPLLEYREGKGIILFCQLDVTGRTEDDPAAQHLVTNMISYISQYEPFPPRTIVYAGEPAGYEYLKQAGFRISMYEKQKLISGQILVVGPNGEKQLSTQKESIAEWLEKDGRILAISLDENEINSFLPLEISTENEEYINTYFEPVEMNSPITGIGPADVLNRMPRPIPLISDGTHQVGNGVLASKEEGNVVFCQLFPWHYNYEKIYHNKITFRRTAFLLTRLLSNMGATVETPLLSRFSTPCTSDEDGRWLSGMYLDEPVEMDDPYRFFRW